MPGILVNISTASLDGNAFSHLVSEDFFPYGLRQFFDVATLLRAGQEPESKRTEEPTEDDVAVHEGRDDEEEPEAVTPVNGQTQLCGVGNSADEIGIVQEETAYLEAEGEVMFVPN